MTHYEGRLYTGLMRHLILVLIVMGFVCIHADGLRGGKCGPDAGAGVPGAERPVRGGVDAETRDGGVGARGLRDTIPPTPLRPVQGLPQEAAA